MESTFATECPFHSCTKTEYQFYFKSLPNENFFQKIITNFAEYASRFSWKSLKNAWQIGVESDLSKVLAKNWKKGSLISKCATPAGIIYLTADPKLMRVILQNHRKDEEGIFLDHINTRLFIRGILNDIFPDDIKKIGIDRAADLVVLTARSSVIKLLRAPLVNMLSASSVKDFMPKMNEIADNILDSLSIQEKENCDAEKLALEFAVTIISKLITGYNADRENYKILADSLNAFSKRMTRIVSHQPATKIEEEEYQIALQSIRHIIESNLKIDSVSPMVKKLKDLKWSDFQIRVTLFFVYFAASETTASSINYLLWQLGKSENKQYVEKIKNSQIDEAFFQKVIAETLRLHPPSFVEGRQFRCNTLLEVTDAAGKLIKKIKLRRGNTMLCLSQVAALDSAYYKNPDEFNPERFDNVPSQLPWYPFGTGNHVCPGQHLAHAEMKVIISRMLNKFSIETLFPKEQTQQKGFFTLRATAARIKLIENQ